MVNDLEPAILRSRCGLHRYVLVTPGIAEFSMPLLPYKKNANMDYYTKNIPEGTPYRVFRRVEGAMEYGAYAEKCSVFHEVENAG